MNHRAYICAEINKYQVVPFKSRGRRGRAAGSARRAPATKRYSSAEVEKVKGKVLAEVPASGKGKNAGDIAEAMGFSETVLISAALSELKSEGKVKRSDHADARGGRFGDYLKV